MRKNQFIVLSKNSAAALGTFSPVPWHKQEKENILRQLDIKVDHGQQIQEAKDRGTFFTVSDQEHGTLLEMYASGLSMSKVSKRAERSSKTVSEHLHKHDEAVERSGFCPVCQRIKGQYVSNKVLRASL